MNKVTKNIYFLLINNSYYIIFATKLLRWVGLRACGSRVAKDPATNKQIIVSCRSRTPPSYYTEITGNIERGDFSITTRGYDKETISKSKEKDKLRIRYNTSDYMDDIISVRRRERMEKLESTIIISNDFIGTINIFINTQFQEEKITSFIEQFSYGKSLSDELIKNNITHLDKNKNQPVGENKIIIIDAYSDIANIQALMQAAKKSQILDYSL